MRAHELVLRRFKGHPATSWHGCTPELILTYLRTGVADRCRCYGGALAASALRRHIPDQSM